MLDGWQRVENLSAGDPEGLVRLSAALNAEGAYHNLRDTVDDVLDEWEARSADSKSLAQWRTYHRAFSMAFNDNADGARSLIGETFGSGAAEDLTFDKASNAVDLGQRLHDTLETYQDALNVLADLTPDAGSRIQEISRAYSLTVAAEGDPETQSEARLRLYPLRDMAAGSLLSDADRTVLMPDGAGGSSDWLEKTADAYQIVDERVRSGESNYREWARVNQLVSEGGATPELRQQLVDALNAENAHHTAELMINDDKNTVIDPVGIQTVLGSSMHITSWWGRLFKFGALDFTENSGVEALRAFFDDRGYQEFVDSGEVIGNDPNATTQWHYQRTLYDREKYGSEKITEEQVDAYLQNRLNRMSKLQRRWVGITRLMGESRMAEAQTSLAGDAAFLESLRNAAVTRANVHEAGINGVTAEAAPDMSQDFINITISKYALSRVANANDRITDLQTAISSGSFGDKLRAAKAEAALASKSMNTAGDYMSIPSIYRYLIKGISLFSGEPTIAGITIFHGVISNSEWLRAQQGAPIRKIWGVIPTSPTGIETGYGLFFSKVFGRGYNSALSSMGGEETDSNRYTVTHLLMLEEGDVAARNRARKLLLVTALVVPVLGVLLVYAPFVKHVAGIGGHQPVGNSQSKTVGPANPGSSSGSHHRAHGTPGHTAPGSQPGGAGGTHKKKHPSDIQYVVLPLDGLNVRTQPSDTASVSGEFPEGTFVESTSTDSSHGWIRVTGPGASGWVEDQYLALHPEGSEGATGRDDPTLAQEGYKSVVVADHETLSQIAADSGVDLQRLLGLDERYLLNPSEIYPGDRIYLPGAA